MTRITYFIIYDNQSHFVDTRLGKFGYFPFRFYKVFNHYLNGIQ
jgi:hypothetical protein